MWRGVHAKRGGEGSVQEQPHIDSTEEEEEVADLASARACVTQPLQLHDLDCALIQRVGNDFQVEE